MPRTSTPKKENHPRSLAGLRAPERCRVCDQWTPAGTAAALDDVRCADCAGYLHREGPDPDYAHTRVSHAP